MLGHRPDVGVERVQVQQERRRVELFEPQSDRAELQVIHPSLQTCEGISNRSLYSLARSLLASGSFGKDSVAASKVSLRPRRWAMLPRWQSRVLRWPISISAVGRA